MVMQAPSIAQSTKASIIDTHVHVLPGKNLDFANAIENAITKMDRYGIATAILMSPPRSRKVSQNFDYPDFTAALKKYPGRFLVVGGGGTLNLTLHANRDPALVDEKIKEVFAHEARKIASDDVIGFGEIGSLHISLATKHAYSFVPADHPLLKVLADVAADRNIPIDLHMDAVSTPMKPSPHLARLPNNPDLFPETLTGLDRLLAHNPKARIIWAHGGTDHLGDFGPAVIGAMMARHDNLFVSLKVVGPKAGTYNRLFTPGAINPEWLSLLRRFPDRFVIGTDSFFVETNTLGPGAQFAANSDNRLKATRVFLSLLPADLARKISRENALLLYSLTSNQAPEMNIQGQSATPSVRKGQKPSAGQGLCRDGNMAHCEIACGKGHKQACARLRRGN